MSERDFSFNNRNYKLNKLDAFKQYHIVRRLAPILGDLLPALGKLSKKKKIEEIGEEELEAFTPIFKGFANLSDEDANRVLLGLIEAVEIQQTTGNWARVVVNNQLMFQDFEFPELMQLAGRAFMYNLGNFLKLAPQVSKAAG